MANNTYKIEYASLGRAVCKLAACKKKIEKGELRVGKTYPNDRFTEGGTMTDWYHAPCVFQHLKRARKTTKKIDSEDDLEGYSHLHDNDQKKLSEYIQGTLSLSLIAFAAGEDIENPYLGGGDGGSGGEEKKTSAKKKAKAKAPEPVIPAHLLNRNKNKKPKRTEKKNVEVELFRARILKEGTKTPKYLPMDSQPLVLGRGDETGITDKRCSRTQLELVASQADKTVTLTMLGNNPTSFVFDEEGEPQPLTKGQQVDLPNGSRFILFVDDVYVVQTRTDKVMQEVEVEVADEDDEATDEDEELQRQAAEAAASKKRKAPAAVPKAGGPAAKKVKAEPKPKAPPKKNAKKKGGGGGIDLDGTIDSDDDGQPNEYDYDDGFLVRNDASLGEEEGADDDDDEGFQRTKRRRGDRHDDDDDAEALREARQYLQGFDDGDEGESKQAYKNGKPVCRYGATCYRVNPDHRKQFWHPSKIEAGDHAAQSTVKTQQTTPRRKPAPTPTTAGRGGGDDDAISEEEDGAAKHSDKDRDAAGKVKTLSAMSAFRELDSGIIRDVLEANNGSLHLTMEALKSLTAQDL